MSRPGLFLSGTFLCFTFLINSAHAQRDRGVGPPSSHVLLPDSITRRNEAAAALISKLGRAREFQNDLKLVDGLFEDIVQQFAKQKLNTDRKTEELLKGLMTKEDREDFLNKLDRQNGREELQQFFRKTLADNPELMNPKQKQALRRVVGPQALPQTKGPDPIKDPQGQPGPNGDPDKPDKPNRKDPANPDDGKNNPPPSNNGSGQTSRPKNRPANQPKKKDWVDRRVSGLTNFGNRLAKRIDANLGDAFDSGTMDLDLNNYTDGFADRIQERLGDQIPDVEDLGLEEYTGDLEGILSRLDFRSGNDRGRSLSRSQRSASPGSLDGAAASVGSGLLTLFLGFLGIVVVLVLCVLVISPGTFRSRKARTDPWKPGPWPVAPEKIRTQGDLIRTFEHLALICLGLQASSTNHRDIAHNIGENRAWSESDTEAVNRLADLYERARYAPREEALAEAEVIAARRDLCLLAGVSA